MSCGRVASEARWIYKCSICLYTGRHWAGPVLPPLPEALDVEDLQNEPSEVALCIFATHSFWSADMIEQGPNFAAWATSAASCGRTVSAVLTKKASKQDYQKVNCKKSQIWPEGIFENRWIRRHLWNQRKSGSASCGRRAGSAVAWFGTEKPSPGSNLSFFSPVSSRGELRKGQVLKDFVWKVIRPRQDHLDSIPKMRPRSTRYTRARSPPERPLDDRMGTADTTGLRTPVNNFE